MHGVICMRCVVATYLGASGVQRATEINGCRNSNVTSYMAHLIHIALKVFKHCYLVCVELCLD